MILKIAYCQPSMCMGFGCNAAGIISTRIIDSKRDKLLAILTNNFVPCNGRFPGLIMIATLLLTGIGVAFSSFKAAIVVSLAILSSIFVTLMVTKILSKTLLKGLPANFILELPPYRRPKIIKTIVRSLFDKTFVVLGRAVTVAAPAGIIIFLLSYIQIDGFSIIYYISNFFDPFGRIIGLDGIILTAFILGIPANEIVIPLMIMCYVGNGSISEFGSVADIGKLFASNGWTVTTMICTMIFSLNHFPCATTLITIAKETKSAKWTAFAFLIPTVTGIIICFIAARLLNLIF